MNEIPGLVGSVSRFGLRRPKTAMAIWVAVALLSIPGLARLTIETSTDSVLDRSHPDWSYYREVSDRFGSDEIVVIAAPLSRPLDRSNAQRLEEISVGLDGHSSIRRIDGVSTIPSPGLNATGLLSLDSALRRARHSTSTLGSIVEADRVLASGIVSVDLRTDSLVVRMEAIGAEHDNAVVDSIRTWTSGGDLLVSGGPVFRVATNELTQAELAVLGPITAATIGILIWAFFGSLRAVGASFLAGAFTVCPTLAIMGMRTSLRA